MNLKDITLSFVFTDNNSYKVYRLYTYSVFQIIIQQKVFDLFLLHTQLYCIENSNPMSQYLIREVYLREVRKFHLSIRWIQLGYIRLVLS